MSICFTHFLLHVFQFYLIAYYVFKVYFKGMPCESITSMRSSSNFHQSTHFASTITLSCNISHKIKEQHTITICLHQTLQIQ